MDPEHTAEIMRKAREHIAARDADQRALEERQRNVDPFAVDPLERWREQQRSERTVPPPRERQPTIAEIEQLGAADWNAWLRGHLDQERSYWESVIAEVIARERRDADAKVAKLETRIAVLGGQAGARYRRDHRLAVADQLEAPRCLAAKCSRLASTCAFANFGCWRREPSSRSAADATMKLLHDLTQLGGNVGRVPTSADLPHRQGVSRSNRMQTLANRRPAGELANRSPVDRRGSLRHRTSGLTSVS